MCLMDEAACCSKSHIFFSSTTPYVDLAMGDNRLLSRPLYGRCFKSHAHRSKENFPTDDVAWVLCTRT